MSRLQPLRVLFFSPSPNDIGGSERALYALLEHLPRDRIRPEVLLHTPATPSVRERLSKLDIPFYEARFRTWLTIRKAKKGHLRLFRFLDNLHIARRLAKTLPPYDLIYSNNVYAPLGAMIAMFRRSPHIWHIHEHTVLERASDMILDWPPQWSMGWARRYTQLFLVYSEATRARWGRYLPAEQLMLVTPGLLDPADILTPRVFPPHNETLVMCIVGGLIPGKRQHEAIQALALVRQAGIPARLLIAGTGLPAYEAELKQLTVDLDVQSDVVFLGFTPAFPVFDQSDVHLMCTRSESAPRVAIESMARGCPTVATDIDGVREFIIDGVTGLHYPLGQPEALAAQIIRLWRDPALYAQLSRGGVEFVRERFLMDDYVKRITSLIESVVAQAPAT